MRESRFDVQLTRAADKDIKDYRRYRQQVEGEIQQLEDNPYKGRTLSGSLRGVRSLEFSLPGAAHRALYIVLESDRVCLVFLVASHEGIYNVAKRRFKALRRAGR